MAAPVDVIAGFVKPRVKHAYAGACATDPRLDRFLATLDDKLRTEADDTGRLAVIGANIARCERMMRLAELDKFQTLPGDFDYVLCSLIHSALIGRKNDLRVRHQAVA